MRIAIKNPAPLGRNLTKWGDYHFGESLQKALAARGAEVVQHYWPEWEKDDDSDVVLVLRGKRDYVPPKGKISVLWVISHPATVSKAEIDRYSMVYVASETHRTLLLEMASRTPIEVLRQCTDQRMFCAEPLSTSDRSRRDIVFVANSRGVRRDVVDWALKSGIQPAIVGRHWRDVGLSELVTKEYVENSDLPTFYRSARLSLNDHWGDMVHFGYINNRIFDCLACGLPVLSDDFPELRRICGNDILYARDAESFWSSIQTYLFNYPEILERTNRLWTRIGGDHSFDNRAKQLIDQLEHLPRKSSARRINKPGSVAGENPDASGVHEVIDQASKMVQSIKAGTEMSLLHVGPTPVGTQTLAIRNDVNYLSAGITAGPWHVVLQEDAGQISENRFDLIFVQDAAHLTRLPTGANVFLSALFRRVKVGGVFVVPASVEWKPDDSGETTAKLPEQYRLGWTMVVRSGGAHSDESDKK